MTISTDYVHGLQQRVEVLLQRVAELRADRDAIRQTREAAIDRALRCHGALERIAALDHGNGADAAHMIRLAREALDKEAKP